jgi:hypothetical protein
VASRAARRPAAIWPPWGPRIPEVISRARAAIFPHGLQQADRVGQRRRGHPQLAREVRGEGDRNRFRGLMGGIGSCRLFLMHLFLVQPSLAIDAVSGRAPPAAGRWTSSWGRSDAAVRDDVPPLDLVDAREACPDGGP